MTHQSDSFRLQLLKKKTHWPLRVPFALSPSGTSTFPLVAWTVQLAESSLAFRRLGNWDFLGDDFWVRNRKSYTVGVFQTEECGLFLHTWIIRSRLWMHIELDLRAGWNLPPKWIWAIAIFCSTMLDCLWSKFFRPSMPAIKNLRLIAKSSGKRWEFESTLIPCNFHIHRSLPEDPMPSKNYQPWSKALQSKSKAWIYISRKWYLCRL